jgi:hypothetical protein
MTDITVTSTGVILKAGNKNIPFSIPNFNSLGINPQDSSYHFYKETDVVGSKNYNDNNYISQSNIIWNNLKEEPFPTFGFRNTETQVFNGSISSVPILGDVTHYLDDANRIVANVTTEGHLLNPGVVIRYFYEENGKYYIDTFGFGNGLNPGNANENLADFVWENNSQRIFRESMFEDNRDTSNFEFTNSGNLSLFNNFSIAKSFTSLGYSSSFVDDFDEWGYDLLGYDNGRYDDFKFDFGGSNYTIFGEDDRLRLDGKLLYSDSYFDADFSFSNALDSYSFLDTFSTYQNHISPLAFDLDNDGIESTGIYDTRVYFDIDGDQFAEKVGWIAPDDGLLALDVNGDGVISDITELFGDDIMPAFDKLARHDSNGDGAITAADADYARLKVWRDFDQDGFSDANELFALNDASISIKSIFLAETPQETYQNENYISGSSSFTRYNNTTSKMYDVHFLNDNVNTWFMGARSEEFGSTYEVSPEALLMPLSRGYGSLASLHIAMTDNKDLRTMMRELVNLDASDIEAVLPANDNRLSCLHSRRIAA